MSRDNDLPFAVGSTYGATSASDGAQFEGREYTVDDVNPATGARRSNKRRRLRVVRNTSGGALLPKRLVTFKATAGSASVGQVDGMACVTAARAYPIDEYLPAAGCANNDLCYIVVEGPAVCYTAAGSLSAISVGSEVVAATAATSGAATAGRVNLISLTGATSLLADQIRNRIGYAMSAVTANNTDSDLAVDVGRW